MTKPHNLQCFQGVSGVVLLFCLCFHEENSARIKKNKCKEEKENQKHEVCVVGQGAAPEKIQKLLARLMLSSITKAALLLQTMT